MLRDTFFRVQSYHTPVPLTGTWYAVENDNTYSIMNDSTVKSSYTSMSRGFGKVNSVFNTEYIVFSKTKNSIYCIDANDNETELYTTANEMSFICTDNDHILVAEANSAKNQLTVTAYIIVGNSVKPFLRAVSTKTISATISGGINGFMNSVKLDATSGVFCRAYENSVYYSCKATKPAGNSDDLVLEKVTPDYNYLNMPVAGAKVCVTNNSQTFYNSQLNYYCTIVNNGSSPGFNDSVTITIYSIEGTELYTATIDPGASGNGNITTRIYLDNDTGNGYITMVFSSGSTMYSRLYSITGWTLTQVAQTTATAGSTPPNSICGSGLFPLINNTIPPILIYAGGTYIYKASYTTTTTSIGAPTNTDATTFGSRILWI